MPSYGVSDVGFLKKTYVIIRQEMVDDLKLKFGEAIDTADDTILGQMISLIAYYRAEGWDLDEYLWHSFSPSNATGEALSRLVELNGIQRLAATKSTCTVLLQGIQGTTVPAGFQIAVKGTDNVFETVDEVFILENGYVEVETQAQEYGAIQAPTGTLTEIRTPIVGITACINENNAITGRNEETDAELRKRRIEALTLGGTGTADALYSAVRTTAGVTECKVVLNESHLFDEDGRPPNCFEVVVIGGTSEDIAKSIWTNKPAGIPSYGNTLQLHIDTQGVKRRIYFTRPDEINLYVTAEIVVNSDFPINGCEQVADNIDAYGKTFMIGQDVIQTILYGIIHKIDGVIDINYIYIGTDPESNNQDNISVKDTQIAKFDVGRIIVTVAK